MIAKRAKANFIPALNSIYLTEFDEAVKNKIKQLRNLHIGGDKYLGDGIWEVSEEAWKELKKFPHTFIDEGIEPTEPAVFRIENDGKYLYQELAASELRKRTEALLFFDTGTGKTRTALLALSSLSKDLDACIVVGEAGLSVGWMRQVEQWFPEFAKRFVILNDGTSIPQRIQLINKAEKGTIFILNIESVRNRTLVDALNQRNLAVTVLDECQCIIGVSAQQTSGMHRLNSDFRWALSATPIKNNPLEWHSLLAWLRVVRFDGMITRFKEYYGVASRNRFGQWEYNSFRNAGDLENLKNLVTIRVEKEGLGLLPRVDRIVELEGDENYYNILKQIDLERRKDDIDASFKLFNEEFKADNVSALFYIERLATALASSKIDYIMRQTDKPMVIVSCLKFPLDYLHKMMPDSVLYHGDLNPQERQEALRQFIGGEKRVLLMTRRCGGTGLDGLQKRANIMMFLDVPENLANFNQCADRLHRNGQEKEVLIETLQIKNSLDSYAWENLTDKQSWIDRYFKVIYGEE